jgi:hypothetical protein
MSTLDKAITLAQRGLPVFFCGRSKRPTLEGGFHNATTDIGHLRLLYEKAPGDLIGVPCGAKFVVIDPDLQHKAARQWLKENKHRIPVTRTHRTASGGLHFLFKPHPDFRTNVTVHEHVDTRGADGKGKPGSYVIWWPALGLPIFNPNILAEVPQWIIDAMPAPDRGRRDRNDREAEIAIDTSTPIGAYLASVGADVASAEAAFAGILRTMANAAEGQRQCVCHWCANRMFELIRDGGLDHAEAVAAFEDVAINTTLSAQRVQEVIRRVAKAVLT